MTPEQISLVQSTWRSVLPIRDQAAVMFYDKLFEMDPALRSLFKADMTEQRRQLMMMINTAVAALNKLDSVVPTIQELGRRHTDYGVRDEHYETVGGALLWTLERGLGEAFTAEVKEAWTRAYGLLADTMKAAAAAPAVKAATG